MSDAGGRLIVVGAGPAGLSAALAGAEGGLDVTVIDESARPGGQYFRGRQESDSEGSPRHFSRSAQGIGVMMDTAVIDAPAEGRLTVWSEEGGAREIAYDRLVIATGAYDRPVAIPGWTLPGVLAAGGASTLAKLHGIVPGRRTLVAGSGPFLLAVADDLSSKGCSVDVIEATPFGVSASGLRDISGDPEIARQTLGYLARLALRGVRRRYGEIVTRIHGRDRVQAASISEVNLDWTPVPGTERTVPVDAVCLGFGFVPQLELPQALDCDLLYDDIAASHFVAVDGDMRSSRPGIYAAGEVTGIGGMRVAIGEGRLAGLTAAHDAGRLRTGAYEAAVAPVLRRLKSVRRVADWLRDAYRPRAGLWALADADTVLCRCEDVKRADAERALRSNPPTPYAVKTMTRAGMGLCQGRICGPYLAQWLRARHGYAMPETRPWRIRPPLRPVPLGDWPAEVRI